MALSANTLHNYNRILKHLNNGVETTDMGFLRNTASVLERVKVSEKGYKIVSDNTQKSRLTCVMGAMTRIGMRGDAYDIYKAEFNRLKTTLNNHLKSGKLSAKQEANWIEKDDLDNLYNVIKEKAEGDDSTFKDRQDLLLLALYTKMPPQRNMELFWMKIIIGKAPEKLDSKFNWLLLDDKRMIINVHKNTATTGTKFIDISKYEELLDALVLYVSGLNRRNARFTKYVMIPLLTYDSGHAWQRSDEIREQLNRIFGKRVGAAQLRTMMATHNAPAGKEALQQLLQDAADAGHSLETHIKTYMKARNTIVEQ